MSLSSHLSESSSKPKAEEETAAEATLAGRKQGVDVATSNGEQGQPAWNKRMIVNQCFLFIVELWGRGNTYQLT
jgi:hypothetical protein